MLNWYGKVMGSVVLIGHAITGICQEKDTVSIEIMNTGIAVNSPFSEFAPVISADGLTMIFTSRRPVTEKEIKKNRESFEHVYISEYDREKKKWSRARLLPETINDRGVHNSAIAISNDGQRLLLYRNDPLTATGNIFESVLKGEDWTKPTKLPAPINSNHHESSASIAHDGRTIYFVSDRPKGQGERDIWYCKQDKNGDWGEAKNIGYPVNTKQDEEGVFIHPDGKTLYFSSRGHYTKGMGGHDIYRSVFEDGEWSEPENLGAPLNTTGDDVFFVMEANCLAGYYSSSKPGGFGEKDIYKVLFVSEKDKERKAGLILLKGVVSDEISEKPVEATITIMDNEQHEELSTFTSNSATGKYLVSLPGGKNYGINVSADGYLFHSENFQVSDTASYLEIIKDIPLKKIEKGSKISLKNIFYDFNKASLREESKSELNRLVTLLNKNSTLKIEISSHTDSKGSDEYNKNLSQERAQSVVNHLIENGISKERLTAIGYGESDPIADNNTEAGRQLNRRTAFTILGK